MTTQHTAKDWDSVEAAGRLLESPTNWENVQDAYQILASVVGGKSCNSHDALLAAAEAALEELLFAYRDYESPGGGEVEPIPQLRKAIAQAKEGAA